MDPLILPLSEFADSLRGLSWFAGSTVLLTVAGMIASLLLRRSKVVGRQVATGHVFQIVSTLPALDSSTGRGRRAAHLRAASHISTLRLALHSVASLGLVSAFILTLVEYQGAEPFLKFALGRLQARTAINLTFQQASGGPLRGEYTLRGVRIQRDNNPHSNFDLTASEVTVRFTWWKLLCSSITVDGLNVSQLTGSYHKVSLPPDEAPKPEKLATPDTSPESLRSAGNVTIAHVEVQNATIDYVDTSVDGPPVAIQVGIESLACAPLRTAVAPYDIFFRSNIQGTLDQKPFRVETTVTDTGRHTEWNAEGLSIGLARAYVGGPFRWLIAGEFDARLTQDVLADPRAPVVLNTKLQLRGLQAGVPSNTKPAVAVAVQVLTSHIKSFPKQKTLEFKLELDRAKFDLTKTEDRHRLWEQFREAMVASLLQSSSLAPNGVIDERSRRINRTANEITDEAIKAIQRIRERRKQKKAERQKKSDANSNP